MKEKRNFERILTQIRPAYKSKLDKVAFDRKQAKQASNTLIDVLDEVLELGIYILESPKDLETVRKNLQIRKDKAQQLKEVLTTNQHNESTNTK